MAVELEPVSLIVPKQAIAEAYPGGLDAYAEHPTYLEDEHLTSLGFMSTAEADEMVERLCQHGLALKPPSQIALVQGESIYPPAEWLEVGELEGRRAAWWRGAPPGRLIAWEGLLLRFLLKPREPLGQLISAEGIQVETIGTRLTCRRGAAEAQLELVMREGRLEAVFAHRARRAHLADDFALIRELRELLLRNGASAG